jgi:hypothetical protein
VRERDTYTAAEIHIIKTVKHRRGKERESERACAHIGKTQRQIHVGAEASRLYRAYIHLPLSARKHKSIQQSIDTPWWR